MAARGFLLLSTLLLAPQLAHAYEIATTGVEIVGRRAGPVWEITVETDTPIGSGAFNVVGATSYTANGPTRPTNAAGAAYCLGVETDVLCGSVASSNGLNIGVGVFEPKGWGPNLGSPALLGTVDNLTGFDYTDSLFFLGQEGFHNLRGVDLPTTFVVVHMSEPGTGLLLALGLLPLGWLRRYSA